MKLASTTSFESDAQPAPPVTGVTGFFPPADPERLINDLQRENAQLRRAVAELESYRKLAYRDALTGLWNRRYSLMILDLNDLKRINDVEGHAAGDEAIKRAAAFLKSRLREHDVLCRVGGDEFAVILREMGQGECAQLVHRLRGELAKTNMRRPGSVSLSIGTASFPEDASTTRELYLRADEAMYQDKRRIKAAPTQTDLPFA